jgi:hypothetical protein
MTAEVDSSTPVLRRATSVRSGLSVATLSWDLDSFPELFVAPEIFEKALVDGRSRLSGPIDLIVSAGCQVSGTIVGDDVLSASSDVPILFEVGLEPSRPWNLLHRKDGVAQSVVLRREQLVERFDQLPEMSALAAVVARGSGFFRFEGLAPTFLLLICGENNAVARGKGTSVLRRILSEDQVGPSLADLTRLT